ncbi:precorrin-6A synthase (deacetylating) [Gymnodinialimonas ceratoperidinii]|uniref:Precorrin-6A synthase [deacetylating] n=1 Tax=Gymnodinialimonas ceratoperidinii TaxID=2856823 RepID=A0A8F6U0H4_9RHOB|nr:precorrin-6A synthase (deacetylating) [Gymnodinialimonas ceratoperidinii]QXT41101.1 precorrin-6A synthase (deacetylating) [Gymnodinialimonas ceratoperidinii]
MDLWLIGIGTGNPEHVTLEAQRALREAAVILVPRKGPDKSDLAGLRHRIIRDAGAEGQIVEFDYPTRDPAIPYKQRVRAWHDEIARRWTAALSDVAPAGAVALLVWGDPSLYDSTLRIASRLSPAPAIKVVPGITALQALTAAHGLTFNTLAGAVTVTTGRRLREHGWPERTETLIVMLDGECSFQTLGRDDLHIWWGAYLGMPEQILDHGPLAEAAPRIIETRAAARAAHGWIMDTYLLRPKGLE